MKNEQERLRQDSSVTAVPSYVSIGGDKAGLRDDWLGRHIACQFAIALGLEEKGIFTKAEKFWARVNILFGVFFLIWYVRALTNRKKKS